MLKLADLAVWISFYVKVRQSDRKNEKVVRICCERKRLGRGEDRASKVSWHEKSSEELGRIQESWDELRIGVRIVVRRIAKSWESWPWQVFGEFNQDLIRCEVSHQLLQNLSFIPLVTAGMVRTCNRLKACQGQASPQGAIVNHDITVVRIGTEIVVGQLHKGHAKDEYNDSQKQHCPEEGLHRPVSQFHCSTMQHMSWLPP